MSSSIKFKLVIEEDGKEVFSDLLSHEDLANIVSNCDDDGENNDFYLLASKHPASAVRENVAYKGCLSEEIISLLINDKSISVLRNLVGSEAFKENATNEDIQRLLSFDIEIAQTIASDLDSYQQADVGKLYPIILSFSEPSILVALADNSNTPKKILKELANNQNPFVAKKAKRSLEY